MVSKRIHSIYSIVLSICTVITGILLILACIGIYNQGERPFTPETVAAAFGTIALPVYICIALIIGGLVLDGFSPTKKAAPIPEKQYPVILEKLYEKHGNVSTPSILKEQRSRKLHRLIAVLLLIAGSIIFLCYSVNRKNFDSVDITGSVQKAVYLLLPCVAVPFAYSIFAVYRNRNSIKREIALVKAAAEAGCNAPALRKKAGFSPVKVRWVILIAAIALVIYGFTAGGTQHVLTKAVNICTECVGLG